MVVADSEIRRLNNRLKVAQGVEVSFVVESLVKCMLVYLIFLCGLISGPTDEKQNIRH